MFMIKQHILNRTGCKPGEVACNYRGATLEIGIRREAEISTTCLGVAVSGSKAESLKLSFDMQQIRGVSHTVVDRITKIVTDNIHNTQGVSE